MAIRTDNNDIQKLQELQQLNSNSLSSLSKKPDNSVDIVPLGNKNSSLLNKLGITQDELTLILAKYPEFMNAQIDIQLEIVKTIKLEKQQALQAQKAAETAENETNSTPSTQVGVGEFNKAEYNKLPVSEKIEACFEEFAKNVYIYGVKDHDGNVKSEAHSLDEWNSLTPEEQQEFVNKVKTGIDNNEKLSELKKLILENADEKALNSGADAVMRGIQASNMAGKSYIEFIHENEYSRMDMIDEYLNEQEALYGDKILNDSDKSYKKYWDAITSEVKKLSGNENYCSSDAREYLKRNNLTEDEMLYKSLKHKISQGIRLSDEESKLYNSLNDTLSLKSGRELLNRAKARNLENMQAQYDELSAKDNLSSYEEGLKNDLNKYLNSEEANRLRSKEFPKPQTDFEKSVYNDIKDFQSNTTHIKGVMSETGGAIKYIEDKIKAENMSPEDAQEYRRAFMKFYDGVAGVRLHSYYVKKYPHDEQLGNRDTYGDQATVNYDELSDKQADLYNTGLKADVKSGNIEKRNKANSDLNDISEILSRDENAAKPELDARKADTSDIATLIKDEKLHNKYVDINATIQNSEIQKEAMKTLMGSENVTNKTRENALDILEKYHEVNRKDILDSATSDNKEVTAYASEKNIVSKLGKDDQTEGFELLHNRINDLFTGDEAVKYSKALADQIQYCDKSNQLDMHNEIMKSKYSEVQEYAAGNINKLDPSVQSDALHSVYNSGNEKAIEAAVDSIKASPDCAMPEIRETVHSIAVEEAINNNQNLMFSEEFSADQASGTASLQEKISGGYQLSREEYDSLSPQQKREYFANYFKQLPLDKKIKLLASIPDGAQKKTIYTMIARTNSNLFNAIIKDKDRADSLLAMGLPNDVNAQIYNVVSFLAVADIGFKNIAEKYEIDYDNVSKSSNKSPVTNPYGFDTKEIYKKDKQGNFLV